MDLFLLLGVAVPLIPHYPIHLMNNILVQELLPGEP